MENSQYGTPKIDAKAISDFRKIIIPMIRRVTPALIASQIIGVQPMGLGPPVCNRCMLIGRHNSKTQTHPWRCPCCGDYDLKGSLWGYLTETQKLIEVRSRLFETRIDSKMKIAKILHRRFMFPDDNREPNERYRPWLEEHVGKQGEMWNWDIAPTNTFDLLEISFAKSEHALLFELTCP